VSRGRVRPSSRRLPGREPTRRRRRSGGGAPGFVAPGLHSSVGARGRELVLVGRGSTWSGAIGGPVRPATFHRASPSALGDASWMFAGPHASPTQPPSVASGRPREHSTKALQRPTGNPRECLRGSSRAFVPGDRDKKIPPPRMGNRRERSTRATTATERTSVPSGFPAGISCFPTSAAPAPRRPVPAVPPSVARPRRPWERPERVRPGAASSSQGRSQGAVHEKRRSDLPRQLVDRARPIGPRVRLTTKRSTAPMRS
jgi:hypothetical protein